jgi:hypothetical protein
MKNYLPPVSVLCDAMGIAPAALTKSSSVNVPTPLFLHLIKLVMRNFEIDVDQYMEMNPDIEKTMKGQPAKMEQHFKSVGYFETRPLPVAFDEGYYRKRYPDIDEAIRTRKLSDAKRHFLFTGVHELRSPSKDYEDSVAEWKAVLALSKRKL